MCCFSGKVNSVTETKIFGRFVTREGQALAYQMRLDTPADVAMILPIPVVQPAKEDSVEFIDLSGYEGFFDDLARGFPMKRKSLALSDTVELAAGMLEVHSVGSFDASFIPTVKDFGRLDARFRLPEGTWAKLPQYANYGFTIFKMKNEKVHPMAFSFPSALGAKGQVYFPTVHIHDGEVHAKEKFDHLLYAQTWPKVGLRDRDGWWESEKLASQFTSPEKSKGLIWDKGHVYRKRIVGLQKNEDIIAQAVAIG
jgi:hypothetical protein